LTIIRSGCDSHARIDTYTLSSSNAIQTSVFSVAGSPAVGSDWMKSEIGVTVR
jgi:hypothetical protein